MRSAIFLSALLLEEAIAKRTQELPGPVLSVLAVVLVAFFVMDVLELSK